MAAIRNLWRLAAGAAVALGLAAAAAAGPPKVTAVPGEPTLALGTYDLKTLGYVVEEFFLAGDATSYKLTGPAGSDGHWQAETAGSAPFVTRIVVVRPSDPKRFNGTAAVEWLNVTPGMDISPDWSFTHRELMRSGYAYVGVSAQKVGIEGGPSMAGPGSGLKKLKPERYSGLSHPGDAFAYDIYSQAGRIVRDGGVLGPLKPRRVLSLGESQSAIFLTTYVNAIDPLAKVFDGFLVHSRFGGAPRPDGGLQAGAGVPAGVKLRTDLRVPVLTLIAETDLIGSGIGGFWAATQPDNAKLRIWEMPGTAHADTYMLQVAASDSGSVPTEKFAELWKPSATSVVGRLAKPINSAPQHHYIAQSALSHLEAWVRTGRAPPSAPRMETVSATPGGPPKLVLDAQGNAEGGIRTPWVDAPTAKLSGLGNSGGAFGFLFGTTETFDAATLKRLYPGGKADYLKRFDAALARAVKAGYILPADQDEARRVAATAYPG